MSFEKLSSSFLVKMLFDLTEIQELYRNEKYYEAYQLCEEFITASPETKEAYWYMGLLCILKGDEEGANIAWMTGMINGEGSDILEWSNDLIEILDREADYQSDNAQVSQALRIRQQAHEINPEYIDNSLKLLQLYIQDGRFSPDLLSKLQLTDLIQSSTLSPTTQNTLLELLRSIFKNIKLKDEVLDFVRASVQVTQQSEDIYLLLIEAAHEIVKNDYQFESAIVIGEIYLSFNPDDIEFLAYVSGWYHNLHQFDKAIEFASRRLVVSKEWVEKVFSSYLVLKAIMGAGGYWNQAEDKLIEHERLLIQLSGMTEDEVTIIQLLRLICSTFFLPYFRDNPETNRALHNLVGASFEKGFSLHRPEEINHNQDSFYYRSSRIKKTGKIRVGYISHCFSQHSVGWITRWLLKYHDRNNFELYGYVINYRGGDTLQDWYLQQFDHICKTGTDCSETGSDIAQKIYQDEIDILVDLDSITLDLTCEVMAYKPAPIQATWLGWDASGIPAIDYFIADSYVLPEEADTYYSEKIYRLPQTYVAVDGFEVDIQTLKREELDIPTDAIIYMTSQGGYKRHPDTIRLQLSIIKHVPNSYLLVKGPSDRKAVELYFNDLAEQVGVEKNRLRFLPSAPSEAIHRANLKIADVVLDTYPYNGATTTLETLWMEIPLVTLVGKQFSARNSYTMLKNVGVEEGIAWSAEEYIEWGIRFGKDENLRREVTWKLRQSKNNAPLWNSKEFAKDMSNAYLQMWKTYQESNLK
jgi:predicted O-linked N-acetylglucosamine transferase (SPINDLY family)